MAAAPQEKYDVFISYRRENNNYIAELLHKDLTLRDYSVFLDTHESVPGEFPPRIETGLRNSNNFLLILSDGALDRCSVPGDWVTKEISLALEYKKKIIPVVPKIPFAFPADLPEHLLKIKNLEQIELNPNFYQASIEKLVTFLSEPKYKRNTVVRNTHSEKKNHKWFLYAGLILFCISLYIGLFFTGRYVAQCETKESHLQYLLSELSRKMKPEIRNGDELFFVYAKSKEQVLLFDYKNERFSLERTPVGVFSQKEFFITSVIVAHAGLCPFIVNSCRHLKFIKNSKGRQGLILTGVAVVAGSSYFYGKYTILRNIYDPFDSKNIAVLNDAKISHVMKKILVRKWKDVIKSKGNEKLLQ